MIYVNHDDEIVDRGKEHAFPYDGVEYVAYTRLYGNGTVDVEVYPKDKPEEQADDEVYEYAWKLFEPEIKRKLLRILYEYAWKL